RAAAAARSVPFDLRTTQERLALAAAVLRAHAESALARLPASEAVFAAAAAVGNERGSITKIEPRGGIHLLSRREVANPGAEVRPGTLSSVPALKARFDRLDPQDEAARRAALADWLADARNPLTWRSIANRIWQYHFDCGLCD